MNKLGFSMFLAILYSFFITVLNRCLIPNVCFRISLITVIFIILTVVFSFLFHAERYFSIRMQLTILIFFYVVFYFFIKKNNNTFIFTAMMIELLLVIGAFALCAVIYESMHAYRRTESRLAFSDVEMDITQLVDAEKITETNLNRAKREKAPMTFLLINFDPESFQKKKEKPSNKFRELILNRWLEKTALQTISSNIRETDIMVETKTGCIILLPKTDKNRLGPFIKRMTENFQADMDFELIIKTAQYPDDGESYQALLSYCEQTSRYERSN